MDKVQQKDSSESLFGKMKGTIHVIMSLIKCDRRSALKKAYAAASEDPDRKKIVDDWSVLDVKDCVSRLDKKKQQRE